MIAAVPAPCHGRPAGRPFCLWALLALTACASAPPAAPAPDAVVRSTLGTVTAAALRPELEREHPGADGAARRAFLEEWLFTEALAAEARLLGLDRTADGDAAVRAARRDALVRACETQIDAAVPPPTDAEIAAFLAGNQSLVRMGERLRLRHIFKRVAPHATAAERERARAAIEELRRQVVAGADLGALARAHSDSETAKFDGLMAYESRGQLPRSVETVVWALQPGELSDVVETRVGFHVFRLEERRPPETLTPEQQRDWARLRLGHLARQAARERERSALVSASGAVEAFEGLDTRGHAPDDRAVFRLGADELRVADLVRSRERLPFAQRHTTTLLELARAESWARLLEWRARRDRLDVDPQVGPALAAAERRARADLGFARRREAWLASVPEEVLRAALAANPERFASPARMRLRVVVLHATTPAGLAAAHERLESLARDVRAGTRDLAAAAAEMSDDESATQGGDLGAQLPRDFALWAGVTAASRVERLAVGELSDPLQLEVYRDEQLASVPEGFLIARVEAREAAVPRSLDEARGDVLDAYARDQAGPIREAVRAALFAEIHAELFPERLAAAGAP